MQKCVDIEVVGRHALLFDDDAMAAFVNSDDALVEWNSIPIDRYDVRHLLSSPPPPRRRRITQQLSDSIETELDQERYLDLSYEKQETDDGLKPVDAGGYNAVAFSYGNGEDSAADQKNSHSGLGLSAFSPTFPVPENLVIPPTEKLHHIIARTAIFVSKHGGQSEIVLRVKQGDNPTFGFLMPDHHLHSYFRFLVDHSEVLHSDIEEKAQSNKIPGSEPGGGALSLLGSLYGSGEDEDGAAEYVITSKENDSGGAINATSTVSRMSEKTVPPKSTSIKDDAVSDHLINSKDKVPVKPKEKLLVPKRNSFSTGLKAGSSSGTRKEAELFVSYSATDKLQSSSMAPSSMIEPLVIEPPSEMKKLIAKIVEFIIKNGKQFEAVLVEQDSEHGRFPFLLPSNQYNEYYLKVLHEALKSKVPGMSSVIEKRDGLGFHGSGKKSLVPKGSGSSSLDSVGCDIPFDSDRKEKFKMVIGKSKNDGQDPPLKSTQQGVDAAAAAAILQAATRGIRKPNLEFISRFSLNGNNHDHNSGGGQASSLGSLPSSQPQSAIDKTDHNGSQSSAPVVKEISKTAALEAASEAGSREAHLTREQKLKAERLRRAKMFVAMMRSGSVPQMKPESSRGTSVEPQGPNVGADVEDNRAAREGSSGPLEIDTTENIESSAKKCSTDEYNERKARRKYRSNCSNHEEAKEDDVADDEDEVVHKHSRKTHRSRRPLVEDDDNEEQDEEDKEIKHSRKKQSYRASDYSDEDAGERDHKYSRKHRRSRHDEDEEDEGEHDQRHSRKKHRSHRSSHHSRHHSGDSRKHRKRHSSSKDKGSRHQSKRDMSSDEEHSHHIRSDKLSGKVSRSEREELEEGEISAKVSDQSRGSVGGDQSRGSVGGGAREPSVDVSSSFQDQNSSHPTEVSDDLRAKIRAMLLGTL